ncbi:hypothetical protein [Pseudonocardia sp. T1-2H]|uniref:hypothetical protein n=1 Tax=Pseudonocardia sp. T1-2H TaxID=3128899 RepID=UPI003100CDC3
MLVAVVLFAVGLFFLRKKKLARTVPVLWLGAGAGVTGAILDWFNTGVGWAATFGGKFLGGAIVVLAVGVVWLTLNLGHDLHPKHKGAATRATAYSALFLCPLASMLGGKLPEFLLALGHAVNNAGGAAVAWIF